MFYLKFSSVSNVSKWESTISLLEFKMWLLKYNDIYQIEIINSVSLYKLFLRFKTSSIYDIFTNKD